MTRVHLVDRPDQLAEAALALGAAPRLALDAEGSGFHAYRSRLCVLQLALEAPAGVEAYVIDALALDLAPLGPLLGEGGPPKIVHALHMDAEFLRDRGLPLGRLLDTQIAAQLLGLPALGLASLASSRLGRQLHKGPLQQHDWRRRPLTPEQLAYLSGDVLHLFALADDLGRAVAAAGIEQEVAEETRYRLTEVLEGEPPEPGWVRLGQGLSPATLAVLRRLWELRDDLAREADVPAYRLVVNEALVAMARAAPTKDSAARRWLRGPARADELLPRWVEAVRQGLADGAPPPRPSHRAPPPAERQATQAREAALKQWRRQEAEARGVSEQAVLPGHCLQLLARRQRAERDELLSIPGMGAFRVDRYTEAWQKLLRCL